ncbi:hypothetical protein GCM10010394_29780 [Streptomyces crystallinus]|uniref:Uncharacterized protein n=1 Tax=Streptomyces crystallinus TaxID=68191 RepID=A0ABP3QVB6_9ACTN
MPHFSCQLAASRAPKKLPIATTTKAVAKVSLVITVRRYRCSQSLACWLIASSARRLRVGGNGLTKPPCRTGPPRSPVVRRVRPTLFLPPGGPRLPHCFAPRETHAPRA